MINSRDSYTERNHKEGANYEVPFPVGSYLQRKDDSDILDEVAEYKIDKEGILVKLLLDINHTKEENFSEYFDIELLLMNWQKYSGYFVKKISLKPNYKSKYNLK